MSASQRRIVPAWPHLASAVVATALIVAAPASRAQGVAFSPGVANPDVTMGSAPASTVFNGSLYTAFRSNDSRNILFVASSSDGTHFPTATAVPSMVMGSAPAMTVFKGKVYLAFQASDGSGSLMLTSSSDGVDFAPATEHRDLPAGGSPALAVFNNQLVVGFQAGDASNRLVLARSADGSNFSTVAYPNILMGSAPSLASFDNQLYVAFQANDARHDLFVSSSSDGISFPTATDYPDVKIGSAPSLAVVNGALDVAFQADDPGNALFVTSSTTGSGFPAATKSPYDTIGGPPAATAFQNNLSIAFKSNDDRNVLYATGGAAPSTNNLGLPTIPLVLTNNTGSNADLYVAIVGEVNNVWYAVSDTRGDLQATHYSPGLQSFGIDVGTGATTTVALPQMVGMRVYVSFGAPLSVNSSPSGTPGTPAGWVSSDPNYNTQFDWAELTWAANAAGNVSALGGNVTQVDMFGLAMKLSLTGLQGDLKTPTTLDSGFPTDPGTTVRQQSLAGIAGAGAPWNSLVVNANGSPFRAIAPNHGIDQGIFPADQLDGYIASAFSQYANGGLSVQSNGTSFTGRTTNGNFVFTDTASGATFSIPEPTTYSAYAGSLAPNPAPSDPTLYADSLNIAAQLQGALMRTDLLADGNLTACQPSEFYRAAPVNEYAANIHAQALDNHAYGFGYDDTCNQSSYIVVYGPTSMQLSIGPL